jgi:hypothetical protein
VLLAEDAVPIFDAQRQRELDEARWTTAIGHWLELAGTMGATAERRAHLAAAPVSAETMDASRALYLSSADATVRTARREKRWKAVSVVRRGQAEHLYDDDGRPVPPSAEVLELQREALLAELRALQATSKVAELAGTGCCAMCRKDEGRSFPIAAELKAPRLPHADCPKGLCGCDWWMATAAPKTRRRRPSRPAAD